MGQPFPFPLLCPHAPHQSPCLSARSCAAAGEWDQAGKKKASKARNPLDGLKKPSCASTLGSREKGSVKVYQLKLLYMQH